MLNKFFAVKKEKTPVFQVMLLDNDASQEVEVQESEQVDFARVQEHLAHGGSVFITSKGSQKIIRQKRRKQVETRMTYH